MFNLPPDKPRASGFSTHPYGFSQQHQAPQQQQHDHWSRFGFDQTTASPAAMHIEPQHDHHQAFDTSGMDWTPTSPDVHSPFVQEQHGSAGMELESMQSPQVGSGVGRLVAHFENKGFNPFEKAFAPSLPPRPISNSASSHQHQHHVHGPTSPHIDHSNSFQSSLSFDNMTYAAHGVDMGGSSSFSTNTMAGTPMASPSETWGSFHSLTRVTSPLTTTSPSSMAFGSFHDNHVSSPGIGPSPGTQFDSLEDFMAHHPTPSPMDAPSMTPSQTMSSLSMAPPMTTNASSRTAKAIGGTPGFELWRLPGAEGSKPEDAAPMNPANGVGYFKPPVPTTPKPNIATSNQFILELNPAAKARAKAPVKSPRPKVPLPAPTPTSPAIKREPLESTLLELKSAVEPAPTTLATIASSSSAAGEPSSQRAGSIPLRGQAGTRPSREQVPAEAWEQHKGTIRTLYLEERKPLKEVMTVMAEKHSFQATPKMYKTRFSQWGFVKNNTEDEVKRLLSMKFQRDAEGKVSEFVRNGRVVNLGTYLKRKGVTEYDLIDFELTADLPSHVRCRTPTPPPAPQYLRSPDLLRAQELVVGSMRKTFMHCRQFETETHAEIGWPVTMVWGAGCSDLLLEANFYFEARDADQGGEHLMKAFKHLDVDLKQPSPLGIVEILLGMVHRDPGMMTALCKYVAAHSTTNLDRSHPLRQIFTCLYEVQQKHGSSTVSELLWSSFPAIADELEAIYSRRHPYVARTWIDLALFYSYANVDRLDKLVLELRPQLKQVAQRFGTKSPDVLTLRYAILQLLYAASPLSDTTREAAHELWGQMKDMGTVFAKRDSKPNVYCYHSPVKVDPWTKRCRRRYDSGVAILEEHVGVRIHPYFEEDLHTTEHVPDAQEAWSAALGHMNNARFAFI